MKRLKAWEDEISVYTQLSFDEAKELYLSFLACDNEELKKSYMDKLILGTLYVVVNMLKRSELTILKSKKYDMNDIISSANEIWIKTIKSGKLLKAKTFYDVLSPYDLIYNISNILIPEDINAYNFVYVSNEAFINFLYVYLILIKEKENVTFRDITDYLCENNFELIESFKCFPMYTIWENSIVKMFENIVRKMPELLLADISVTKLKNYLKLFIEAGSSENINVKAENDKDYEQECVNKLFNEKVSELLNMCKLTDKQRYVLSRYFGLNGYECTNFEDIGQSLNLTQSGAFHIYTKAVSDLRKSGQLRRTINYKDLYR